jgi:hypothetical protein
MMRKMFAGLLVVFAVLVSGCASVPMGDATRDAELKTFKPKADKAALYVYRNESMGAAIKMTVVLDGKVLGDTAAKTYLYTDVEPGNHRLVSKTENDSTLDFTAVAGKIYYVWQEVKMGLFAARSSLQLVDEKDGQAGVLESKLAAPMQ